MKIHSYGKVWALGKLGTDELLNGPIIVQEKIDGSQFSFGNIGGELWARSKGQQVGEGGNVEGMFAKAWQTAELVFRTGTIPEGMVIRCETLDKPKHNVLAYNRVPVGNIIIYDITLEDGTEKYLPPEEMNKWAIMWGLQTVPLFHYGELKMVELKAKLPEWLKRESVLGGQTIEGIVIKNHAKLDGMGKMLACKVVREEFKEAHNLEWKAQKPGSVIEQIIASFNKENIWQKAIQHAKEDGILLNEPKDIGYLIGAIKRDFHDEQGEAIKKKIFREFYADIERGIMRGFPEWYKNQLLEKALETNE